jgi:hypothetical protein
VWIVARSAEAHGGWRAAIKAGHIVRLEGAAARVGGASAASRTLRRD